MKKAIAIYGRAEKSENLVFSSQNVKTTKEREGKAGTLTFSIFVGRRGKMKKCKSVTDANKSKWLVREAG